VDYHHGFSEDCTGVGVLKLHGSIDWLISSCKPEECRPLYPLRKEGLPPGLDRENHQAGDVPAEPVDAAERLWQIPDFEVAHNEFKWRDFSIEGQPPRRLALGGLGLFKPLYNIPGMGMVWRNASIFLWDAAEIVAVGFSMSGFDQMISNMISDIAVRRAERGSPFRVVVIDPSCEDAFCLRYIRVFGNARFVRKPHELVDWESLT
jgi:hypothetical protein